MNNNNYTIRTFLSLAKDSAKLEDFMELCCKRCVYRPIVSMECMNYECSIEGDSLEYTIDNIIIKCNLDHTKNESPEFNYQYSTTFNILIPLYHIINITPLNVKSLNNITSVDTYQTYSTIHGYYYEEMNIEEDETYEEHDTDGADLLMEILVDSNGNHKVRWILTSSTQTHSFCLEWEYNAYLTFYSHIINVISNKLGNNLLAEYDLLKGE